MHELRITGSRAERVLGGEDAVGHEARKGAGSGDVSEYINAGA